VLEETKADVVAIAKAKRSMELKSIELLELELDAEIVAKKKELGL
jgi:hypothetical protein